MQLAPRISAIIFVIILWPLLVSCGETETKSKVNSFISYVKNQSFEIDTVEPNGKCDDLGFLKQMTEGKNLVALGEARHDGHEFFQIKRRIIECLVREQGFTHLIMEEGLSYAEELNRYLLTGEGDLLSLINGMGAWYIWDTEEFIGLMQWLRDYNATHPLSEQVKFHGMDITDPSHAIEATVNFLKKTDPGIAENINSHVSLFDIYRAPIWSAIMQRYSEMNQTELDRLDEIFDSIRKILDNRKLEYGSGSGDDEYNWVNRQFITVEKAHAMFKLFRADYIAAGFIREKAMTENLAWFMDNAPKTDRFIVWSHNFHIAKSDFDIDIPNMPRARLTPMGVHVNKKKDINYLAVGFSFYESVAAWGLPKSPPTSLDSVIARAGIPYFLIDLGGLEAESDAQKWVKEPHIMRGQGGTATLVPFEAFDALLFVHTLDKARSSEAARAKFSTLR